MPWTIRETDDGYCVFKEGDDEPLGCHDSEQGAQQMMAALHANEDKAAAMTEKAAGADVVLPQPMTTTLQLDDGDIVEGLPDSTTATTEDATDAKEASVLMPDATEAGKAAPVAADPAPPITDLHAQTIELPAGKRVLGWIPDAFNKARGWLVMGNDPPLTGLKIAGNHFLITWSNNFEDREGEIFTEKAIDAYVLRVDSGIVPPPELWVWHAGKAVSIGRAAWVARHGHFLLAGGAFDSADKAQRARDYYKKHLKSTAVSHGFTYPTRAFDGRHYHAFNTFEISLLPRGKEANLYTSLEKVKAMAVTPDKQQYLEEVFGVETAKQILDDLDKRGKALEEIGAAFKDFAEADDTPAAEAVTAASADLKALIPDLIGDSAEVAQWAAQAAKAIQAHEASVQARLDAQDAEIKALKELLDLRPRSASKDEGTVIDDDKLSQEVKDQFKTRHPFWGTDVNEMEQKP